MGWEVGGSEAGMEMIEKEAGKDAEREVGRPESVRVRWGWEGGKLGRMLGGSEKVVRRRKSERTNTYPKEPDKGQINWIRARPRQGSYDNLFQAFRFFTRFLAMLLTRLLARVLTRAWGREKSCTVLPGLRKTSQNLQKTKKNVQNSNPP